MTFAWYIVQAYSGYEKKVAQAIREKAEREEMTDHIEDVVVPTEEVIEVKKGKKVTSEQKFYPGYVLVKMKMSDKAWHMVRTIPRVSGFLGGKGMPQPVPEREIGNIFRQIEEGIAKPKNVIVFETGESVKIIDGPFDTFIGTVEEVDHEKGRLKVSVSIFGRSTPVDLEYAQVEKV